MLTAEALGSRYNPVLMGLAVWIISGVAAWVIARLIPVGRAKSWIAELALSILTAALLGLAATAGDFGGWKEPDWRAGLFAFFGAFTVLGVFRLVTIFRRRPLQ